MNQLLHDLRFSLRMLVKSPLFTGIAIVTLMLGIGLNAAVFSTVNGLLLEPLAGVREPDRIVQLYREWAGIPYGSNSVPHYQDLRDRTDEVFESVAAWFLTPVALTTEGESERIVSAVVSANFFQTLGTEPTLGRAFAPGVEDVGPGAHPVAVLGDEFWRSRFGADPGVVGSLVSINGLDYQVVGVAPATFDGPMKGIAPPIYLPLMMQPQINPGNNRLEQRGNNNMTVVARLRDGVSLEQAQQGVDAVLVGLGEEHPESYENQLGTIIVRLEDVGIHPSMRGAQSAMSAVMMLVVGLLLLIACVNVANLFLARARERQKEVGVRLIMGASRLRVVRQLVTESLVFALIAGSASLGLAWLATDFIANIEPPMDAPFHFDLAPDGRVLGFTLGVSLLAGLLFGLAPALQASGRQLSLAVRGGGSLRRSRMSKVLVVGQMALSLLLLIGSGLFLRSLQNAVAMDPGFVEPRSLVTASVDPSLSGYDEARARVFYDELAQDLKRRPEIASVGFTDIVPLGLGSNDRSVEVPGYEFGQGEQQSLLYAHVGEGYLETMGVQLLEGRTFGRGDHADSEPVIIINQRFAERFWPGQSALGKTVTTAGKDRQVVGVVATGKYLSLGESPREYMYLPLREQFRMGLAIVARTDGPAESALTALRSAVAALDPKLPVFDVRSMEDHMGIALLPAQLGGYVLGLFGILGLILAAVGIYGVMAYSVAQRRRELGVRVALGASRRGVQRLVLGEGMLLAGLGAALGLVAAAFAGKAVSSLLYGTSGLDPLTFLGVPALLLAVAGFAVLIPARRAARSDPMAALRAE